MICTLMHVPGSAPGGTPMSSTYLRRSREVAQAGATTNPTAQQGPQAPRLVWSSIPPSQHPAFHLPSCPFMIARRAQSTHLHLSMPSWKCRVGAGWRSSGRKAPVLLPALLETAKAIFPRRHFCAHWPEPNPVARACCKGGWESRFWTLGLREVGQGSGKGSTGPQHSLAE